MIQMPEERVGGLLLGQCSNFEKVWDDGGTGAKGGDLSVWRVVPPQGWHSLGCYAEPRKLSKPQRAHTLIVKEIDESVAIRLLTRPLGYDKVWDDRGTGAKFGDLAFWRPIAPLGYAALGDVATNGWNVVPSLDAIVCVHESILAKGKWPNQQLWWDKGTGGKYGRCSVWTPQPDTQVPSLEVHTFRTEMDYCWPLTFPPWVLRDTNKPIPQLPPITVVATARKVLLMAPSNGYYITPVPDSDEVILSPLREGGPNGEPEQAFLMHRRAERIFFTSNDGRRLAVGDSDKIVLVKGEGEVIADNDLKHQFFASVIDDNMTISSAQNGNFVAPTFDFKVLASGRDETIWKVSYLAVTSGTEIRLRAADGRYLAGDRQGRAYFSNKPGREETWVLQQEGRNIGLMSQDGFFLTANPNTNRVEAGAEILGHCERLMRRARGGKQLELETANGRFVSQHRDEVRAEAKSSAKSVWSVELHHY